MTALTFKTLFYDHLRPGGFYAIEDRDTGYGGSGPDMGLIGFVRQLVDECALSDIRNPRGVPGMRKSWIRGMQIVPGLVIVEKARE